MGSKVFAVDPGEMSAHHACQVEGHAVSTSTSGGRSMIPIRSLSLKRYRNTRTRDRKVKLTSTQLFPQILPHGMEQ